MKSAEDRPNRTGSPLRDLLETFEPDQVIEWMRNEAEYREKGHNALTLTKGSALSTVMVCIQKGERLNQHQAPGSFTLTMLRGRINFGIEAEGEKIDTELSQGQFLVLQEPRLHEVEALEESAFLLTIVNLKAGASSK
ncbi:MAG TPA: hypothetical protein VH186_19530 [Chloroflexia bacterium]|nr:hypothetical protein [Chloroflexia bacterium]